jgi:predicted nucleic acid-binding protein
MRKIFLDANIVVDFLDGSAQYHRSSVALVVALRKQRITLYISPSTFVIANHVVYKYTRNRLEANKKLKSLSKYFLFTGEDQKIMDEVFASKFEDLEDALQYYSAKTIAPDYIITHNNKDFPVNDKKVINFHFMVGLLKEFR